MKGIETERKRLEMALIIMIEMFICKLRFFCVLFQFYDFLNFRIRTQQENLNTNKKSHKYFIVVENYHISNQFYKFIYKIRKTH